MENRVENDEKKRLYFSKLLEFVMRSHPGSCTCEELKENGTCAITGEATDKNHTYVVKITDESGTENKFTTQKKCANFIQRFYDFLQYEKEEVIRSRALEKCPDMDEYLRRSYRRYKAPLIYFFDQLDSELKKELTDTYGTYWFKKSL